MNYRRLGATDISVSEIGFGTWGIGGVSEGATSYGETNDFESLRALAGALEKGVNFYDTAGIYGDGHAEELLGKAFRFCRHKVVIATKVGLVKHGGPHNISPSYIRDSLNDSLRRLKSDYVDVLQFHNVPLETLRVNPQCLETVKDFKKNGKIRAFGYSAKNPVDALTAIGEFGVDLVQINFNMIDQRAIAGGVFAAAQARNVGIVARTPFCFGFLTGKITNVQFSVEDHRSAWPREQIFRWMEAPKAFSCVDPEKKYTPAQLALRFCLSFPEVSTTIAGMLTVGEVEENVMVSDLSPLTAEQILMIKRISQENEFFIGGKIS